MVNNNNVGICTKFFQCDVSLIKQFSLNFFNVVDNNIDQTQIVVPCFIKLWDNCDDLNENHRYEGSWTDSDKHMSIERSLVFAAMGKTTSIYFLFVYLRA